MTRQITIDAAAILDAAAERIRPAGAWTQDTSARDEDGKACDLLSGIACSWCAVAAIYRETYEAVPSRLPYYDRAQVGDGLHKQLKQAMTDADIISLESIIKANDALGFTQAQMCDLLGSVAQAMREKRITLTLTLH